MSRPLVVVVVQTRGYANRELAEAAKALDVELRWVTDRCHVLAKKWPDGEIAVDLTMIEESVQTVATTLAGSLPVAVIGTDEPTAVLAEAIARFYGVSASTGAAKRARDKLSFRRTLTAAGLAQPAFAWIGLPNGHTENGQAENIAEASAHVGFPAVLKPRCLSASRGVVRVNSEAELGHACTALAVLLGDGELTKLHGELLDGLILEKYLDGPEIAFEGLLIGGVLQTIAVFDKPNPLIGPTFPETLYVTPSELSEKMQQQVADAVAAAAFAIELRDGPVHAELRIVGGNNNGNGVVVIELAARSIGGLCGRTLELACGASVAEIVLAGLCGIELRLSPRGPAGVLMIGVRQSGVFLGIDGIEEARSLRGIHAIEITTPIGKTVGPLPERSDYIGFAFASGESNRDVTQLLRQLERQLKPRIRPQMNTIPQ